MLNSLMVLLCISVYLVYITVIMSTCDWWLDTFGLRGFKTMLWVPFATTLVLLPLFVLFGYIPC